MSSYDCLSAFRPWHCSPSRLRRPMNITAPPRPSCGQSHPREKAPVKQCKPYGDADAGPQMCATH